MSDRSGVVGKPEIPLSPAARSEYEALGLAPIDASGSLEEVAAELQVLVSTLLKDG